MTSLLIPRTYSASFGYRDVYMYCLQWQYSSRQKKNGESFSVLHADQTTRNSVISPKKTKRKTAGLPGIELHLPLSFMKLGKNRDLFNLSFLILFCRLTIPFDDAFVFDEQFLQVTTRLNSSINYGLGEHNHRQLKLDMNYRTWAIFTRDVGVVVSVI